jgi:diadenosine tetraphosphatase ApaH/serine/threonine PP2A family protein phosphatase
MKRAIISDIHANLAAFEAVLQDIERQGIQEVLCLGDILGYGPDPRACLELARRFPVNLMGNHEEAVLFGAIGFNPKAKAAIDWTREQLSLPSEPIEKNRELWNFIGSLAKQHLEGEFLFVHGSPRDPTREYIFYQDWQDRKKMDEIFASPPDTPWKVCFTGHTHYPGVFVQDQPYRFLEPKVAGGTIDLEQFSQRLIINVGSVGQPRDGDRRASYAILEDGDVRFHRVEYDVKRTIERFRLFPDLPEYLARRLEEGK